MADDLGIGQFTTGLRGVASSGYDMLIYGALVLAAIGLIVFIWWWYSHNRLVMINYVTKGGVMYYTTDMAKKVHFKGAEYWKLRRLKKRWLAPPGEVIRITAKGKFAAEGVYKEAEDQITWVRLDENIDPVDQAGNKVNPSQTHFAPDDRALLVEQLEEAENRKKGLLSMLMQLAPGIMIFLIFLVLFLFWGDVWEPMQQSQQHMAVIEAEQAKVSDAQGRIMLLQVRLIEAMMEKKIIDPSTINIEQEITANADILGLNATRVR